MKKAMKKGKTLNAIMHIITAAIFGWVIAAVLFEQVTHVILAIGLLAACYGVFFLAITRKAKRLNNARAYAYKHGNKSDMLKANREAEQFRATLKEIGF